MVAIFTQLFEQYLRHTALPVLELKLLMVRLSYRRKVDEQFAMPIRVVQRELAIIRPTLSGRR
jgi:hypothetical protein